MAKSHNNNLHVVLIEDDPMVQQVNKMFVDKVEGFSVVGLASNGEEGRQLVEKFDPDLVLLDIFMPKEDGVACVQRLREARQNVDIIAVTAANNTTTIEELLRAGVIDYIVKPFTFERLKKSLEQYRERKRTFINQKEMSQDQLDEMMLAKENMEKKQDLPKGLQEKTLDQVMNYVNQMDQPKSAEEIGKAVGLARVTVRRYLNYLESIGQLEMELTYGQIGRPIQLYRNLKHSKGTM